MYTKSQTRSTPSNGRLHQSHFPSNMLNHSHSFSFSAASYPLTASYGPSFTPIRSQNDADPVARKRNITRIG